LVFEEKYQIKKQDIKKDKILNKSDGKKPSLFI
jgi:hypothetical protein